MSDIGLDSIKDIYAKAREFERKGLLLEAEKYYREVIKHDPFDAYALNFLGRILTRKKDYAQAVGYFKKALQIKPNYSFAALNLGILYVKWNLLEEAKTYIKKAIELNKNLTSAYIYLIWINIQEEKFDEALMLVEQNYKRCSFYPYFHYLAGLVYLRTGDEKKAKREFEKVNFISLDEYSLVKLLDLFIKEKNWNLFDQFLKKALKHFPFSPFVKVKKIYKLIEEGEYEDAILELKSILMLKPDFIEAKVLLAKAYNKNSLYKESEDLLIGVDSDLFLEDIVTIRIDNNLKLGNFNEALSIILDAISKDNFNDKFYYLLAKVYFFKAYYKEAIKAIDRAIALREKYEYLKLKGDILSSLGDVEEAMKIFEKLPKDYLKKEQTKDKRLEKEELDYSTNDIEKLYKIATNLRTRKLYKEALNVYYKILSLDPNETLAQHFIDKLLPLVEGKNEEILEYEILISKDPENPKLHYKLAKLYLENQNIKNAINQLEISVVLEPDYEKISLLIDLLKQVGESKKINELFDKYLNTIPQLYFDKIKYLLSSGDYQEAIDLLDQIPQQLALDSNYFYLKLLISFYSSNWDEVVFYFKKLPDAMKDEDVVVKTAKAYRFLRKLEEAKNLLENWIQDNEKSIENEQVFYELGAIYKSLGDKEKAKELFLKVVTMNPEDEFSWYNLGIIYKMEGNFIEAKKSFEKVLKLNPTDIYTLNQLGLLMLEMDLKQEALTYFKAAIVLSSEDVFVLSNLALTYEELGDLKKALKTWLKSWKVKNEAFTAFHIASCLESMGEFEKAFAWWSKVKELANMDSNMYKFAVESMKKLYRKLNKK